MKRGSVSFLSSRSAPEAFETVRGLYVDEGFVVRRVAKRLAVHYRTLYRWLAKHPEYSAELEKLRADALEKAIKEN